MFIGEFQTERADCWRNVKCERVRKMTIDGMAAGGKVPLRLRANV